ncbi:MAG: bis(5'-nucleosyl)-tetraphosphatase (symmetrical) YqeK [Anaerolineae bacterium]|nr:bis(5'-nucleosyl)-tetraphosphatase (symmetrical) YqeK [Anaerolineae bacterium]
MHELLSHLIEGVPLTGNVSRDMRTFLIYHGHPKTAGHSLRVAEEARQLAARFNANETQAEIAGWLHDVSAVFPSVRRADVARQLGLDVLPEEEKMPMIVHQKLSAILACEVFGITDAAVLSAIGCHTTLKAGSTVLDKVVFVADKISWDQAGAPPYLPGLLAALDESLDQAVLCYLSYLWQQRDSLPVLHPWLVAAYRQLSATKTHPGLMATR